MACVLCGRDHGSNQMSTIWMVQRTYWARDVDNYIVNRVELLSDLGYWGSYPTASDFVAELNEKTSAGYRSYVSEVATQNAKKLEFWEDWKVRDKFLTENGMKGLPFEPEPPVAAALGFDDWLTGSGFPVFSLMAIEPYTPTAEH